MDKIIPANYGSIPHLSTSKLTQQADKKIEIGQEKILTEKTRDFRDLIIVTEKIDGSNVGVIKMKHSMIPITRKGYSAESSPYYQHIAFYNWVFDNSTLFNWLPYGWRICGEWCIMTHGTIYDITSESPFVAFDIFDQNNNRLLFIDFYHYCKMFNISMVPLLHMGQPISINKSIKLLGSGHYGKPDKPEGFVYRVERNGNVDFLAKWVRHDKEDGKYLDQKVINQGGEIYYGQNNI